MSRASQSFPGLAHRQELIATIDGVRLRQRHQGDQRRRRREGARLLRRHLLDRGRRAEGRRHRRPGAVFPAHPPRLPDRRGGTGFRRDARRRRCRMQLDGTLDNGGRRGASPPPRPPAGPCCCRRPAPRSTNSPISRRAAKRSARWSQALPGARHEIRPHRSKRDGAMVVDGRSLDAGGAGALIGFGSLMVMASSPAVAIRIGADSPHFVHHYFVDAADRAGGDVRRFR